MRKRHAAKQGIVASENLDTVYQREIFFAVDPATLDWIDAEELKAQQPSTFYVELNINEFLHYLPDLEAEIFWLIAKKRKHQKDIAKLLGLSQPTVSYRYRRVVTKLRYLMTIQALPLRKLISELEFLDEKDQNVLYDLFFFINQEKVGKKHNIRQSSVKWIFVKTLRKLKDLEKEDPER